MAPSTESALTSSIRAYLKGVGCYVNKNHGGPNSQGRPDLEGCFLGYHFGLEVKLPGKLKNVTKLQQKNLDEIREAGGYSDVISSVADAKDMIGYLEMQHDG
jgi:hypothetical protein